MKQKIAVIDSETNPFQKGVCDIKPFIWGYYDGDEYHAFANDVDSKQKETFNCTEKLFSFIDRIDEPTIIYAHNGGKFDMFFFLDRIPKNAELVIIAGRITKIVYNEFVEFRDSYALIPTGLAQFQKDKVDYSAFIEGLRFKEPHKSAIAAYLKSDCVFLREYLMHFIDDYGLSLTIASAAMKKGKKMLDINPSSTKAFYDEMAKYYYGGRVECFQSGLIDKPFQVYDINSAYPFAMIHDHPIGNFAVQKSIKSINYVYELIKKPENTGKYFFTIHCVAAGCFPWRDKNGLHFPNDNELRAYHVTGWEMLAAIETGALSNITGNIECKKFGQTVSFKPYVDHFYNLKSIAKNEHKETGSAKAKAQYNFAKLFLNSLYGKLAANPDNYAHFYMSDHSEIKYLIMPDNTEEKINAGLNGLSLCGVVDDIVVKNRPLEFSEMRYYNVACGASITGFVRAYLYRHLHAAGGAIYCDTDSIACETKPDIMTIGEELGAWECEGEFKRGGVAGKKLYAFEGINGKWKTASKGARLTPDEIMRVAGGETIYWEPEAPTFSLGHAPRIIGRNIKRTV